MVKETEIFVGIGAARLPVRKTAGFFFSNSLGDGRAGDDDMVYVLNCCGGDEERIRMSVDAILKPLDHTLR